MTNQPAPTEKPEYDPDSVPVPYMIEEYNQQISELSNKLVVKSALHRKEKIRADELQVIVDALEGASVPSKAKQIAPKLDTPPPTV